MPERRAISQPGTLIDAVSRAIQTDNPLQQTPDSKTLELAIGHRLTKTGTYVEVFTAQPLQIVMERVIPTLFHEQGATDVDPPTVQISLHEGVIGFTTRVQIRRPVRAAVYIRGSLASESTPGTVALCAPLKTTVNANPLVQLALEAKELEPRISLALNSLHEVIPHTLGPQLHRHGFDGQIQAMVLIPRHSVVGVGIQGEFCNLATRRRS